MANEATLADKANIAREEAQVELQNSRLKSKRKEILS